MAFDNVVDTITLEDIVPRVVDTVLRTNRFITTQLAKTKKFRAATQDFPKFYGEVKSVLIYGENPNQILSGQRRPSTLQFI